MISYSFSKDDTKTRIKNIVLYLIKAPTILGIIGLVFGIYFTVIGIVFDSEMLNNGIPCLVFAFLVLIFCLISYLSIKKGFEECINSQNDMFNYQLYIYKELIMVESSLTQKTVAFSDSDIVGVCWKKSTIIVRIKGNKVVDFLKRLN